MESVLISKFLYLCCEIFADRLSQFLAVCQLFTVLDDFLVQVRYLLLQVRNLVAPCRLNLSQLLSSFLQLFLQCIPLSKFD